MRILLAILLLSAAAWGQAGNAIFLSKPGTGAPVNPPPCAFIMAYVDATNGDFYDCNPATGLWLKIGPTVGGAVAWNSITAPTGNLALAMSAWTTAFTWNAATGAGIDLFKLADSGGNTGTGVLLKIDTALGSSLKPFQASVNGNGVQMSNTGVLAKLGTGSVNADQCNGVACATGTVTNVTWTGGIVSIANPATVPAFTIAGTSGGIPYFSGVTTWASSGALTANLPVIGGGAGVSPGVGTRSGNTTAYVTTTGAQTNGDCVSIDANGNHIAAGAACGTGSGTTVTVNGSALAATTGDLDDATPAAPAGGVNVKFQKDALTPTNVSAYVAASPNSSTTVVGVGRTLTATSPITGGGDLSADRSFACATCVTSAASLTSNAVVLGGGLQASKTAVGFTTDGTSAMTLGVAGTGSGGLTFAGTTSGSATIQVAAAAGTPNPINLPTATGAAGSILTTNGANPQVTSWAPNISSFGCTFDGGGSTVTVNSVCYGIVPAACTIAGWDIQATGASPTTTLDIWRLATGGTTLPVVGGTLMGTKPALASGNAVHSTTLTGWTTSLAANDRLAFNVDAVANATSIIVTIQCNKT